MIWLIVVGCKMPPNAMERHRIELLDRVFGHFDIHEALFHVPDPKIEESVDQLATPLV